MEIGASEKEADVCDRLGSLCLFLGEYIEAEKYSEKARLLSSDSEDNIIHLRSLLHLTFLKLIQSKIQEGYSLLLQCIHKFENLRNLNNDNDQFKISLLEKYGPYKVLILMLSETGNPENGLYVEELGRARALADLMAAQYSVENNISADSQLWSWIENVRKNERNCTCLYISYFNEFIFHWVLKTSGNIHFRRKTVKKKTLRAELVVDLDGLFNKSFRNFGILPPENCEDRSLDDLVPISLHNDGQASLRGSETKGTERRLHLYHKLIVAPVVDLLTEPEIIVVPDRSMYRGSFAALRDEPGKKYFSENFRIASSLL